MKIALAHNHYDENHLREVMTEMKKLGAPTIRVYHVMGDLYQAIEGCHRLRAAEKLEITPNIIVLNADTLRSDVDDLDYEDGEMPEESTIGLIGDWENYTVEIDN